jgi:hypothetical protein
MSDDTAVMWSASACANLKDDMALRDGPATIPGASDLHAVVDDSHYLDYYLTHRQNE